MNQDDWPHLFQLPRTEQWKVKLCRLSTTSWNEFGLGFLCGEQDEKTGRFALHVVDQKDTSNVLFDSVIQSPVSIQKQETLLLWSGPQSDIKGTGVGQKPPPPNDLADAMDNGRARVAIGFETAVGCIIASEFIAFACNEAPKNDNQETRDEDQDREINGEQDQETGCTPWGVIFTCQVQLPPSERVNGETTTEVAIRPPVLPPMPTQLNLRIVLNVFADLVAAPPGREFLIVYLDNRDFIDDLWHVFLVITNDDVRKQREEQLLLQHQQKQEGGTPYIHQSTQFERIQTLWAISDIVKQYVCLGDGHLIEKLCVPSCFEKALAMLEYDRAFGARKANFCDFYNNRAKHKRVVEQADQPVVDKIRQTFRLQMLRDVLRAVDDFTSHVLRNLIFVNQNEIIDCLQRTHQFYDELFDIFEKVPEFNGPAATSAMELKFPSQERPPYNERDLVRNDAMRFIYEVVKTAKGFPHVQMKEVHAALIENGIYHAIMYGLDVHRDFDIQMLALQTLSLLLDFDEYDVWEYQKEILHAVMVLSLCDREGETCLQSHQRFRGLCIEVCEVIKKITVRYTMNSVYDFFDIGMHIFDEYDVFMIKEEEDDNDNKSKNDSIKDSTRALRIMKMIPFLDNMAHCLNTLTIDTISAMRQYDMWAKLAHMYRRSAGILSENSRAQLTMAYMRLIREFIRPYLNNGAYDIGDIITSGIFPSIVHEITQGKGENDAQQSCFLSLLHTIVEHFVSWDCNGMQFQLAPLRDWFLNEGYSETLVLYERYPFIAVLLPSGYSLRSSAELKRPVSQQQQQHADAIVHHPQRQHVTVSLPLSMAAGVTGSGAPGSARPTVDELEQKVYVLSSSNFDAHLHSMNENNEENKETGHMRNSDADDDEYDEYDEDDEVNRKEVGEGGNEEERATKLWPIAAKPSPGTPIRHPEPIRMTSSSSDTDVTSNAQVWRRVPHPELHGIEPRLLLKTGDPVDLRSVEVHSLEPLVRDSRTREMMSSRPDPRGKIDALDPEAIREFTPSPPAIPWWNPAKSRDEELGEPA